MNYNYVSDIRCDLNLNNFKSMIKSLDEGKNINDKEVILGLYYTLYNTIISPLELINENVALEYSEHFNRTMETVIRLSKSRKDMVSAESFIKNFLYYLDNNELSKVSPICDIIKLFREELDMFINYQSDLVNNFRMVDKDFSIEEKVFTIIEYNNYLSDLYITFTGIYGVDKTANLLEQLKNCLNLVFPEIISISNDLDRFNGELRSYIKEKLKEINFNNEFDFYGENNDFAYNLIQELDEDEINVFKLYYLYKLALFEANNFVTMGINDDSMSRELGMDKVVFKKAFKNIARKSKIMHFKQVFGLGKTRKRKK